MNIPLSHVSRARGSAVLVVLVLLACIGLMLYANSQTLYHLKQEITLLDSKQQVKYGAKARP